MHKHKYNSLNYKIQINGRIKYPITVNNIIKYVYLYKFYKLLQNELLIHFSCNRQIAFYTHFCHAKNPVNGKIFIVQWKLYTYFRFYLFFHSF